MWPARKSVRRTQLEDFSRPAGVRATVTTRLSAASRLRSTKPRALSRRGQRRHGGGATSSSAAARSRAAARPRSGGRARSRRQAEPVVDVVARDAPFPHALVKRLGELVTTLSLISIATYIACELGPQVLGLPARSTGGGTVARPRIAGTILAWPLFPLPPWLLLACKLASYGIVTRDAYGEHATEAHPRSPLTSASATHGLGAYVSWTAPTTPPR